MSGWVTPTQPNLADYITFLTNAGFTSAVLPSDSPWPGYALNQAVTLCNPYGQTICNYGAPPGFTNALYPIAVYNLAAHIQLMITPDVTAQVVGGISDGGGVNAGNVLVVSAVNIGTVAAGMQLLGLTAPQIEPLIISAIGPGPNYTVSQTLLISSQTINLQGTFFSGQRAQFKMLGFLPGVISESHDESTGQSFAVSTALEGLSLRDLNYLTTPFGRAYMQYAMDAGELVGIS